MIVRRANLIAIQQDSIYNTLSSNHICAMFDEFLIEFEQMEKHGVTTTNMFLDAVEEIVDAVQLILPYKLYDRKVLSHPLMHFLHQMLITLLDNWYVSHLSLTIQETDIFLKIILIFVHIAEQKPIVNTDNDKKKMKYLLLTKKFLFKIREQIQNTILNGKALSNNLNICTLALLTIKLLHGYPFYYNMGKNSSLTHYLVIDWLHSYDLIQAATRLEHDELLSNIEHYLLLICSEYLCCTYLTKQDCSTEITSIHIIQSICNELLTRFEYALDQSSSITSSDLSYTFERCQQLLNVHNLPSFDKHAQNIIDHLIKILQNPSSTNPNDDALIIVALKTFCNLTKNSEIRMIMKKRRLIYLFNRYTDIEMGEKRKLAFEILAEIMDEQEVNDNSSEITSIFIDQLKQLNQNEYNPNLDNTLSSLNALIQHEQIKNELIKQNGLEKFITFIRDGDPSKQSSKQLEDALKILWSCTFNNPEVLNKLKQDQNLMTRVNHLLEISRQNKDTTLEKAAEGLIWKVEKEEKFIEEQIAEAEKKKRKTQETGIEEEEEEEEKEEEQKYDFMISYSWADIDLAHRIFNYLTEKLGYKVWLDQEQMHGSTIQAMANAVENAEFILMCMSETYKRSANCQSEAEYAFNRKKHIVPIKMKKDYVADGWLGFILGTRMYIDFGTYDFDKAIQLLENEIRLQKKKRKDAKEAAKMERKAAASRENKDDVKEDISTNQNTTNVKVHKHSILNWNAENVRGFLMKHNLPSIAFLCHGINGEELLGLYTMCKTNSLSMYRSLKFELLHGCNRILPISTYLRFMSCMRVVCDNILMLDGHTMNKSNEHDILDNE
ncbi:unnamed protein product [Rotaria sordida]|uniref:TIR domain-containing protein n=1 Tax=Rotaria sordida TaxID=392033 RepID=A0A818FQ23_9BILA|nr:unnamed protein product [Rotaria sordida]